MNGSWLVFPLMLKLHKRLSGKRPGLHRITIVNGTRSTYKLQRNATELGAEVIQKKDDNIANAIMETIRERQITTICLGKPHLKLWQIILKTSIFNQLLKTLTENDVDLVILS